MDNSILNSTKKNLGIDVSYTAFDPDIIMHINSVFSLLNQLGLGPVSGFMIEDSGPEWDAFIGDDPRLNLVKSYMYARVRLIFDPPTASHLLESLKAQIHEFTWYLNVQREGESWSDPNLPVVI